MPRKAWDSFRKRLKNADMFFSKYKQKRFSHSCKVHETKKIHTRTYVSLDADRMVMHFYFFEGRGCVQNYETPFWKEANSALLEKKRKV